jgi:tetratricopeptide (TPR) repeat protein
MIAQKKQDFDVAESWYKKSLAIKEKQSDEHGAAKTYNHLAMIAQERRDLALAEIWLQKSLFIKEKEGDEQEAANIYGRLGILEGMQSRYEEAGCWFIKSIRAFMHNDDLDGAIKGAENFLIAYTGLHLPEQTKLRSLWESAGLGRFPEDAGPSESP